MAGGLNELGLIEVAAKIRTRDASCVEVLDAVIARAKAVQPKLNAFLRIDEELARAQAKLADAELAQGRSRGPLHGVPLAHKDMYYRAGVPSSCGSKIKGKEPERTTATALRRLDAAGAIQFGVLNMAEFAYGPTGHNVHFGPCGTHGTPITSPAVRRADRAPRSRRARPSPRSARTPAARSGCRRRCAASPGSRSLMAGSAARARCRSRSRSTRSDRSRGAPPTVRCSPA